MTSWPSSPASDRVRTVVIGDGPHPLILAEAPSIADLLRWLPPGMAIAHGRSYADPDRHPAITPVTDRVMAGGGVQAWIAAADTLVPVADPDLPGQGRRWRAAGAAWGSWTGRTSAVGDGFHAWPRMGAALGLGSGPWLRTWLWVDRILDRYADLNQARRDAFRGWGWAHAPASTAVGVELALGGAMAWEALGTDAPARRIESIGRQPAARSYGAVFARAGIVDLDGGRVVLVSGTAAIGDDGATLHPHDAPAQIAATLDQVAQIRAATGTEAGTLIHTTVYLPDGAADDAWRAMAGSVPWPVLAVRADVCRPDLRFEIETIAILPRGNPG